MKKDKLYKINWARMVAMLMTIVGIVACSDEEIISGTVEEGTPVMVNFQFATPSQNLVVSTRAMGEETANKVANLYVLGFKPNGEKAFGFYYDTELAGGSTTTVNSKETIPAGTYDIYAVANIDSDIYGINENTDNTSEENLKTFLDDSKLTKNALLTKTVSILTSARNLDRSGASLLMAGALCDKNGNATSANINQNGQEVGTINLKRLDSEITFNFKGGNNVSFTAKRWYVVNAPAKSRLIEHEKEDGATLSEDFFNTYKAKEEERTPVYNNTFTFYMPENRKDAKNNITNYTEREKEIKDSNGEHEIDPDTQRRNYVNAPDYGTYVVVTGHYEGPQNVSTSIGATTNAVAEVQYTIHLGFVGGIANDFFSKRNTKYTYNVTVKGIDSIIVEVEQEEEKQPGAIGDVILGGSGNVYTLDAHYETVLLTFEYDELVKAWGKGTNEGLFTAVANTPYTNMINSDVAKQEDQKWVQVIRNEGASEEFQPYYENISNLQSVQGMLNDLKTAVVNGDKSKFTVKNEKHIVTYTCFVDEFYYEQKDLPTGVFGNLPDNTNIWKSFVNCPNRKMYIICYRKESPDKESSIISSKYIISQRSIQTFYSTEPTPGKPVIAYGTETLNETGNLHFSRSYAFSKDMDNGWANFYFQVTANRLGWQKLREKDNGYKSIKQNETVNKNGNLNPANIDGAATESNYLRAMEKEIVANSTNNMTYVSACLQRNRRTASGEIVSEEDAKWYLPAINQYQSFYIGEAAISQESRLFDYPNEPVWEFSYQFIKHYAASNVPENAGTGGTDFTSYIFWAEEATSVSTYDQQHEWSTTGSSKGNPEAALLRRKTFSYRCMRNLGSDGVEKKKKGEYDPYYSVSSENKEGRVEFKVEKLNPLVKSRGRVVGELGPHFYQDKGNYFYSNGFEVAEVALCNNLMTTLERVTGVTLEGGTGCEALNKNLQPGEAQWRVPNLRELTLMWQEQTINSTNTNNKMLGRAAARTKMPYKYKKNEMWYRKGWVVTNLQKEEQEELNNIGMSKDDNHATTVRCVRDLK